jgi:hypothetical protein
VRRVPEYFERVRDNAATIWHKLTNDPELAGPWHQLFKQIQIPRHVVSELLQNADDAGARVAHISIDNDTFIFSHNGRDFDESDFMSLCRFGYSNKRALHTIGFRGIGFKSIFSVGDRVELCSPSLSVAFNSERFTEPLWTDTNTTASEWTSVRVRIRDARVRKELEKNLREWIDSSASLLFLRSVRSLAILGEEVRWETARMGPIPRSEWVVESRVPGIEYLHIRSAEEPFPSEALAEIRQERTADDADLDFPPCSVEIVLGLDSAIYVVLPTTVRTELPFAVNAPFIQDPGRLKLKEPEISYTNRWLLKRVGKLAAESMVDWIHRSDLQLEERCQAYGLVPENSEEDGTIESRCQKMIYEAFWDTLGERPFLLDEGGQLAQTGTAVAVPLRLLDVWNPDEVASIFLETDQSVLACQVSNVNTEKLKRANCISILGEMDILRILKDVQPPRPASWVRLLSLWHLSAENLLTPREYMRETDAQIVPARGSDRLHAAADVVRVSTHLAELLGDDWPFLAQRFLPLDPDWLKFIAIRSDQESTRDGADEAKEILDVLGLGHATDANRIVNHVSQKAFSEDDVALEEAVRIAQIAARLDATVSEAMRYVTGDGQLRSTDENIVADLFGDLDLFVDKEWLKRRALHPYYQTRCRSCSEREWRSWVLSGKSSLRPFIPFEECFEEIYGRARFEKAMVERGVVKDLPENPYKRSEKYGLHDWDFPPELWDLWSEHAQGDALFWTRLLERVLQLPAWYWESALYATPVFIAGSGKGERKAQDLDVAASWIIHLRRLPCLEDTSGRLRLPSEMLLRTAETEALLDVEPFMRADLDTDKSRPLLLLLGVRHTPTDASGLINHLRALATVSEPPISEILKLYAHLDRLSEHLPTEQVEKLRSVFHDERLILAKDSSWATTVEISLASDESSFPEAMIIHPLAKDFGLWQRVGAANRPTVEKIFEWVNQLPLGTKLPSAQRHKLRTILSPIASRTWSECGRWLNLEGELMRINDLRFTLAEKWSVVEELFSNIRRETADLQFLSADTLKQEPFVSLVSLPSVIDLRPSDEHELARNPQRKPWIVALALGLQRIQLDEKEEQGHVRREAHRLSETQWIVRGGIEIVPFLDSTPMGTPFEANAVWHGTEFLVADRSAARLASPVVEELARPFARSDLCNALRVCYERAPDFVTEYLEETFVLDPQPEMTPTTGPVETGCKDISVEPHALEHVPSVASSSPPVHETEPVSSASANEQTPDQPKVRPLNSPPLKRPTLLERFLQVRGYVADGSAHRFTQENGGWMKKAEAGLWEEHDSSGEVIQCYWVKEHCLERSPLSLPAEIWELCRQYPDLYSLVLTDMNEEPVQYDGSRLQELRQSGKLKLHATEYQLEFQEESRPGAEEIN